MSQKEYTTISEFIKGNLNDKNREEVSSQIQKPFKKSSSNIMKKEQKNMFDSEKAWDNLYKKIEPDGFQQKRSNTLYSFRKIAASIIIIIGLSASGYWLFNNNNQIKYTEISSGNKINNVRLPDGSLLSLNHNSTIKFPKEFSGQNRIVEFSGEAFFDIKKNPNMPFLIKTTNADVTVLGTSFNIETDKQTNITVSVKTGKVLLSKNKKETIKLIAGEIGKIENNILTKNTNFNENYLSWKTKCFEYNRERLEKVLTDINKAYHVSIEVENEEINNLLITTSIQKKNLDVVLDLICTPHNLYRKQNENTIIISENPDAFD